MKSSEAPTPPVRTVGRGAKMRTVVREATLAELAERGYATLTVDGVAQRAGVHKTTVYRNWEDSDSLVIDALTSHFADDIPIPDTGTIEGDLRDLSRTLVATMTTPTGQALLATVLSQAVRLPQLAALRNALFRDRFQRAAGVVTRAIARGELPAHTDPAELLKTLAAPLYFRLVFTGEPVDEHAADRAVHVTLAAAHARALPPA